jgi:hypothetical protein
MIRAAGPDDAEQVCRIYNHYVENTTITFEEAPVSREQMQARITEIRDVLCRGSSLVMLARLSAMPTRAGGSPDPPTDVPWRAPFTSRKSTWAGGWEPRFMRNSCLDCGGPPFMSWWGASPCPMRRASACTRDSGSARSLIFRRSASSWASGSMWPTGSSLCSDSDDSAGTVKTPARAHREQRMQKPHDSVFPSRRYGTLLMARRDGSSVGW